MIGHSSKIARKQEGAIAALLTKGNIEEVARSVGVAPNSPQTGVFFAFRIIDLVSRNNLASGPHGVINGVGTQR